MWLDLASWNLPNFFLLRIDDRAKCDEWGGHRTENMYFGRGGHRTEKSILEGGDTAHTFLMRGTIGVGTPHPKKF